MSTGGFGQAAWSPCTQKREKCEYAKTNDATMRRSEKVAKYTNRETERRRALDVAFAYLNAVHVSSILLHLVSTCLSSVLLHHMALPRPLNHLH